MSGIKRVDPRRPYVVTESGVRRIYLGETFAGGSSEIVPNTKPKLKAKPLRTNLPPQRWHMAVAHSDGRDLDTHAREVIAAATLLAEPDTGVVAIILGQFLGDAGALGADSVVVLPELSIERYQPELELEAVCALNKTYKPEHIFMPDDLSGTGDLGRRLIVTLGALPVTQVVEIAKSHAAVASRGGKQRARVPLPRIVLLEQGIVDLRLPFVGRGEIVTPDLTTRDRTKTGACRDLGLERMSQDAIALEEADIIVAAGKGVENLKTLETLAQALGAAVGASRVAVDEGLLPRDRQIGASGKTVTARTYIAVGISGAVQHLQGIKDCQHVIAINKDAGAPIVKRSDLTVVGDAELLMQALVTRIAQARAQRELQDGGA